MVVDLDHLALADGDDVVVDPRARRPPGGYAEGQVDADRVAVGDVVVENVDDRVHAGERIPGEAACLDAVTRGAVAQVVAEHELRGAVVSDTCDVIQVDAIAAVIAPLVPLDEDVERTARSRRARDEAELHHVACRGAVGVLEQVVADVDAGARGLHGDLARGGRIVLDGMAAAHRAIALDAQHGEATAHREGVVAHTERLVADGAQRAGHRDRRRVTVELSTAEHAVARELQIGVRRRERADVRAHAGAGADAARAFVDVTQEEQRVVGYEVHDGAETVGVETDRVAVAQLRIEERAFTAHAGLSLLEAQRAGERRRHGARVVEGEPVDVGAGQVVRHVDQLRRERRAAGDGRGVGLEVARRQDRRAGRRGAKAREAGEAAVDADARHRAGEADLRGHRVGRATRGGIHEDHATARTLDGGDAVLDRRERVARVAERAGTAGRVAHEGHACRRHGRHADLDGVEVLVPRTVRRADDEEHRRVGEDQRRGRRVEDRRGLARGGRQHGRGEVLPTGGRRRVDAVANGRSSAFVLCGLPVEAHEACPGRSGRADAMEERRMHVDVGRTGACTAAAAASGEHEEGEGGGRYAGRTQEGEVLHVETPWAARRGRGGSSGSTCSQPQTYVLWSGRSWFRPKCRRRATNLARRGSRGYRGATTSRCCSRRAACFATAPSRFAASSAALRAWPK